MQWTLDQLRQFVASAECGSFSAAARRLDKAQSAISTAIAMLEADLGVALFDRSRRNAVLTDAGVVLLREARELLRQAHALESRAQALATDDEARLALAIDEALPDTAISTLLEEMAARFPSLELTLLNATAAEVATYVEDRSADLAFHFDRVPVGETLEQRHIGSVAQGVFVGLGHALAHDGEVERKELARYRQLLMYTDDGSEDVISPSIWRSDSFYSIAEMVAGNVGWAILPMNVAMYESNRRYLVEIRCPALALPRLPVRMLWRQGTTLTPVAQWLQQRMVELLRLEEQPVPAPGR